MDNEQVQRGDDYQYSGAQYSDSHYGAEEGAGGGDDRMANLKKLGGSKRLLTVVGLVIVALVVYKVVNIYVSRHHEKKDAALTINAQNNQAAGIPSLQQATGEQQSSQATQSSNAVAETLSQASASTPAHALLQNADESASVNKQLVALTQQNQNTASQLDQISISLSSLNATMSNLTNAMANVEDNMRALSNRIAQIQQLQIRQETQVQKELHNEQLQREVTYYIQALVPGRAWLQGSNGATLTVRRGDKVPNYGTIEKIDSKLGIVVTSSGKILRFGIHEG